MSTELAKSTILQVLFFFFVIIKLSLGLVFWPGLGNPFVFQNPSKFYISFSWTDSGLCMYQW